MMTDAISVALFDFSGSVLDEVQRDLPAMTRNAVLTAAEEIVDRMIQEHDVPMDRIFGMGVSISGRYIGPGAVYNTPSPLDDWALIAIDHLFEDRFDMPIWVENDGNAAAVGESLVGVGREFDNFAYLFIDTLLGGGIIMNHELMRGTNGNGGEIGLLLPKNIYQHPSLESLRQTLGEYGVELAGVSEMIRDFDIDWPGMDEWITKTRSSFSADLLRVGSRTGSGSHRDRRSNASFACPACHTAHRHVQRLSSRQTQGVATDSGLESGW